jgi:predicted nucleic acid-binding Zn ribbon protein
MIRRSNNPEQIGKILTKNLRNLGIERRLKEENIVLNWSRLVGERIASKANPLRVKDSILFVSVENASWRNELFFMKRKIIEELNRSVKGNVIRDIVFTN